MFLDLERMSDEEKEVREETLRKGMRRKAGKRCPEERESQTASQHHMVSPFSHRNETELVRGWQRSEPSDNWCGVNVL